MSFKAFKAFNRDQTCLGFKYDEALSMVDSNRNSGNNNSGDYNTGNFNSGYNNSGNYNSGNYNSGYNNSGDNNSGCNNSGNYNSGYNNSGYNNSGNYNSGDNNSGHINSGDYNSGNSNSGNWNQSNFNTGHFNTNEDDYIKIFNKPCLKTEWDNAYKPYFIYFNLLKGKSYKESFIESYNNTSLEDKLKILKLPNFDKDVFFEISGIDVSELM